jgi:DNA-binding protein Fis
MLNENFITVSEFAAARGITKQAVYKQLNKSLKEFLKEVDGKKYIDIAALTEWEKERLTTVKQPFKQPFNNESQLFWQKQIEEKDKVIESLLRQVESLQEQNAKLTDLLGNSQVLLAAEKKMYLEEQTKTAKERKGIFGIFKKKK